MTALKAPNKARREPSVLRLKAAPNGWQLTLVDYNLSYQVTVGCEHLDGLFAAMEKALGDARCPWEPIRYGKGEERRREQDKKLLDKLDAEEDT